FLKTRLSNRRARCVPREDQKHASVKVFRSRQRSFALHCVSIGVPASCKWCRGLLNGASCELGHSAPLLHQLFRFGINLCDRSGLSISRARENHVENSSSSAAVASIGTNPQI